MDQSAMQFIEAWCRKHITVDRYEPLRGTARATELAGWLRLDATAAGISDGEIDSAIAGLIGGGHGLVSYLSDTMIRVSTSTMADPDAARLADEDV